jgi:hypothetical protein
MRNIIGFDRATGRVNWKIPGSGNPYSRNGKMMKGDQTDIVNYEGLGIYKPGLGFFTWSHTTREGNELYRVDHSGAVGNRSRLPDDLTEAPNIQEDKIRAWYMPGDRIYLPGLFDGTGMVLGNALFHNGLIYTVSTGGVLRVEEYDRPVYVRLLDLNSVTWSYPYPQGAGCGSSPTLAGAYIYLFGGNGTTLVIKPGREYEGVAKNHIERLVPGKLAGTRPKPPKDIVTDRYPECTVSSPVFDGDRLYYRAERYLYCIGEK